MTLTTEGFSRLVAFFQAAPRLCEVVASAGFYVTPTVEVMELPDGPFPAADPSLSDIGGM